MTDKNLSLDEVFKLSLNALIGCGASEANANPVAESVRDAEADGIRNVGLNYLPHYCEHLKCGKVDGLVEPSFEQTAGSAITADAKHGFAHGAYMLALKEFSTLAKDNGISSLSIKNSYAAGVIGWYVEKLANQGLVGIAFANSPPAIAPWGGSEAFFGTNPLAFSFPRDNAPPVVIDQSSSTTAKVNVVHAAAAGETIPDNWALDSSGNPTTDAKAGLLGSMAPAGGYKGVSMAMIVDVLAGGIGGPNMSHTADSFGDSTGGPPGVGQFFIAIAPDCFNSPGFAERVEGMLTAMCSQVGVRLPGNRRHQHRIIASEQGVWLPEDLYRKILAFCD